MQLNETMGLTARAMSGSGSNYDPSVHDVPQEHLFKPQH